MFSTALSVPDAKKSVLEGIAAEFEKYSPFPSDSPYNNYIRDNKLTLTDDKKGTVTITKTIKGYDVRVILQDTADEDEDEDEDKLDEKDENENEANEEEGKEENENEESDDSPKYSFTVDLKPTGKSSPTMRFFCIAAKNEKLYFETLAFSNTWEELDKDDMDVEMIDPVDFEHLSDKTQDKISDFMDLLKIDDEFARFVQATALEYQRIRYVRSLQKLENFMKA